MNPGADVDDKDKEIASLREQLAQFKMKYDRDVIFARTDFGRDIGMDEEPDQSDTEDDMVYTTEYKMEGVKKELGFWDRLCSQFQCLPIDENDEL